MVSLFTRQVQRIDAGESSPIFRYILNSACDTHLPPRFQLRTLTEASDQPMDFAGKQSNVVDFGGEFDYGAHEWFQDGPERPPPPVRGKTSTVHTLSLITAHQYSKRSQLAPHMFRTPVLSSKTKHSSSLSLPPPTCYMEDTNNTDRYTSSTLISGPYSISIHSWVFWLGAQSLVN